MRSKVPKHTHLSRRLSLPEDLTIEIIAPEKFSQTMDVVLVSTRFWWRYSGGGDGDGTGYVGMDATPNLDTIRCAKKMSQMPILRRLNSGCQFDILGTVTLRLAECWSSSLALTRTSSGGQVMIRRVTYRW